MKSFPEHISVMGMTDEERAGNNLQNQYENLMDRHPLAQELQQALMHPETTDIAAYARLVEQILGELSLIKGQISELLQRRERIRSKMHEKPTKLTLSDEDADRIVECLASMRAGGAEREH